MPPVPVGAHRVDTLKEGYAPYTATVTVENGQTAPVTATLNNDGLDEDGLLDGFENGYRDGFGRWHTPDLYLIDTDGDGLSDGFEAGEAVTDENGTTYFRSRSDPDKADTDDDGLDDLAEFEYGTDPFSPDSDGDGLRDSADPDPLTPQASGDVNLALIGRDIILGATFGEAGLPGGVAYKLGLITDEIASSPYYMVGWIGFSCLPVVGGVADIRDAVQAILNGDPVGAAMNAAGAIPGPGDGVKITGAIACYTGKFPWKARELGVLLSKEIMPHIPDTLKIQVWDVLFDGAATRWIGEGITTDNLLRMTKGGVHLDEVVHVVKVGNDAIPLTRESFDHIIRRHISGTEGIGKEPTSLFPTSEPVVWKNKNDVLLQYPGTSTLTREQMIEEVKNWIDEAIREKVTQWPNSHMPDFVYPFPGGERAGIAAITVGINQKTGIATAYPTRGSQVFMWYNNMWNPTV